MTAANEHEFLLQRVQPAMVGLIDGSLSTLAPIFSVAIISHKPFYAFVAGLATSFGAGISMAFSEGLSDTGELTGRGNPFMRGGITGVGTFIGGILHSLPFLIPAYHAALVTALLVVGFELIALAWLRARFFSTSFATSLAAVSLAGAVIVAVSVTLGASL
jgi:erythrin-vacuolar iron transport family protein